MSDDLYEIVDPRPIAAKAPYTFFLPSPARLRAIGKGDLVKGVIRSIPPSQSYGAERMWVTVTSADEEWLEGTLDSTPADMPNLPSGSPIRLPRSHVVDVIFVNPEIDLALDDDQRGYWDRCLVDDCVLREGAKVDYLYRETPDITRDGDKYPDSGWRIRGDTRGVSAVDLGQRKLSYVAVGAVLNRDDSWLHLIDEPVGYAFERDPETGLFVKL